MDDDVTYGMWYVFTNDVTVSTVLASWVPRVTKLASLTAASHTENLKVTP